MITIVKWMSVALVVMTLTAVASFHVSAQQNQMTFFVSSAGSGNGANLGGVAGADKICQTLAAAAGAGNRTWHAYLSAAASGAQPAVNAKDRIGTGPWTNVKGVVIAKSVADLHSDANNLKKDTALTEKGGVVNGVGDTPNQHDILTGSAPDGTLMAGAADTTCSNWTAATDGAGSGQLGHVDRMGRGATGSSWNSAHPSRGCSQTNLVATGGNGYLYCFAVN
ncbi:MAG TPA: hypothetical protein VI485_26335 [Vicinamibacterales bacterium]|nr:hypothetical protein [Vicinamibacterales bacterium]